MMEDFNRDNAAIDAALKSNADAITAETAAREAADTALGKKAGLQLIQTLTLATGSDYASAEINIDWSQWAEVYVDFQLAYSGPMKSYDLFFTPNNNYLVRTAYGTHILAEIQKKPGRLVVTAENHTVVGGLGSLVANLLVDNQVPAKMKKIALPDQYLAAGTLETLQDLYGVSTKAVTEQLRNFLK